MVYIVLFVVSIVVYIVVFVIFIDLFSVATVVSFLYLMLHTVFSYNQIFHKPLLFSAVFCMYNYIKFITSSSVIYIYYV